MVSSVTPDYYEAFVEINFVAKNSYGDKIDSNTGTINFTKKLKAKTITELGKILINLDEELS